MNEAKRFFQKTVYGLGVLALAACSPITPSVADTRNVAEFAGTDMKLMLQIGEKVEVYGKEITFNGDCNNTRAFRENGDLTAEFQATGDACVIIAGGGISTGFSDKTR